MRQKEFKAVFDSEKYVMPQDMKYRVKNRISEKTTAPKPFVKRSVSAMVSIVLASILVVTAAAVGGIALFQSIYGENIDPIMPYSEVINTTAADENYQLTLHEAVADEYTTAYIFSVKQLKGNAATAAEVQNSSMIFKGLEQINDRTGSYTVGTVPSLKEINAFNAYDTIQIQMFTSSLDSRVKILCTNVRYDAENAAKYLIRSIDSLKTGDTDYYALYVINGESQVLSIAVGTEKGPEIALPKVTQKAPSVTRSVQDYYRQYLKQTEPAVLFGSRRLADSVTITPLAVYVNSAKGIKKIWASNSVKYIDGAFYRTAELVFNDGTEKALSEMSQDEVGILVNDSTGIFLFNEVLNTALVKSFLVYDTVEFPMDEKLPVIDRETGESIVPTYETLDLMYDVGDGLAGYIGSTYPGDLTHYHNYCWGPIYSNENSCKIDGLDFDITLTAYDAVEGETLADAANRLFDENRTKYNWTVSAISEKDGTFSYGNIRYMDVNVSVMGGDFCEYHYFFFVSNGKLLVMQLSQKGESLPYSLDAVKQLITFS